MATDPYRALLQKMVQAQSHNVTTSGTMRLQSFERGEVVIIDHPHFRGRRMRGVITEIDNSQQRALIQQEDGDRGWWDYQFLQYEKEKISKPVEKKFDPLALDACITTTEVKDEIKAVLKQHKNADKLFNEWGLGEVVEYGRGMTFMFYGGPGTGKTWMAHCIAKATGQELLTVSAAEIQSSEPGAANRNIQQAFTTAKEEGKILFLDECDGLITSRNDVGMVLGSEINTLLTEIEKFEGIAILATNRVDTLDEALERRIALIVEFPEPNHGQRIEIWKRMLPKKLLVGTDVLSEKLADHALTGGQRYKHLIFTTFGSWKKALEMLKMTPRTSTSTGKRAEYSDEELLEYLVNFAREFNKVPTSTDFRRGLLPGYEVYTRRWGSIENARRLARVYDFVPRETMRGVVKQ